MDRSWADFLRRKWWKESRQERFFFELMTPAWKGSSTVEIAQSGFRETGMFPVNYDAIPLQHAFEPSLTTDRPLPNTG